MHGPCRAVSSSIARTSSRYPWEAVSDSDRRQPPEALRVSEVRFLYFQGHVLVSFRVGGHETLVVSRYTAICTGDIYIWLSTQRA